MNYYPKDKEFQRYAKSEHNISSNTLDLYTKESSLTPYILEEREMRARAEAKALRDQAGADQSMDDYQRYLAHKQKMMG